jgi:hypothetical protein
VDEHSYRRVRKVFARPGYGAAAVIIAVATCMASLFVASYTLALGRPVPHHIPTGIVGNPAQQPALVDALEAATRGALDFHPYPSESAAAAAIGERTIYAALILGPGRPRFLVASAAGASVARLLQQTAYQTSQRLDIPVEVVDVRPLPPSDPQGLTSFYVTLGATILGFLTMFQLRANASELTLRGWLAATGAVALVGGLTLTVVTSRVLGALHGPFAEIWFGITSQIAVAALFCSTMLVLFGRWALIWFWLVFIILGNASSGGAVAPPLLPPLYAFIGGYMSAGATVSILHNAMYFRDTQHIQPFVVQAVWLVCCFAALLLSIRLVHRLPTGQ